MICPGFPCHRNFGSIAYRPNYRLCAKRFGNLNGCCSDSPGGRVNEHLISSLYFSGVSKQLI
ncbi:hypothetical protein D3C75_1376590 [compost metagenome]